MEFKDYIVSEELSVLETMDQINKNTRGIVYICDDHKLKGVVTDGNIRRYIINNGDLKAPVAQMANMSPKYLERKDSINVEEFMEDNSIKSVPIVNSKGSIISIKFLHETPIYKATNLDIPVVIMAGGKGTRLEPFTQVLPKPLIPIGDKTITELIMDKFSEFGCHRFDMIVNYKKNLIKTYFNDMENDYNVVFTDEHEFLGTGGGLKLLDGKYDSTFFMTNCDIIIEQDYSEVVNYHKENKNMITVVGAMNKMVIPYGTIEVGDGGKIKALHEKPTISYMSNTGFYIIEPEFLKMIPENTFIHITDIIDNCIKAKKNVGVYPVSESAWLDVGQFNELEKTKKHYKEKKDHI